MAGFCTNYSFGQNLVINGSFEEYVSLQNSPHYNESKFFAIGWLVPYEETPDHYSKNNNNIEFNPNTSLFGRVDVQDGNSLAGLGAFSWNGSMEHLIGTLEPQMEKGSKYEVSFLIKYSVKSSKIGVPAFSILFSEYPNIYNDDSYNSSLVEFKSDSLNIELEDSTWLRLKQVYIANGYEKYFKLGYFITENKDNINKIINRYSLYNYNQEIEKIKIINKNTKLFPVNIHFDENSSFYLNQKTYIAYYFIDDVRVIKIE